MQTPNIFELIRQSYDDGVFRKGKIQQMFFSKHGKYTCKMVFALSSIRSGASTTLCEPNDVGFSCDFSKNSPNPGFRTIHMILDCISRSIESTIGLDKPLAVNGLW